jgi:hypothetical protein
MAGCHGRNGAAIPVLVACGTTPWSGRR